MAWCYRRSTGIDPAYKRRHIRCPPHGSFRRILQEAWIRVVVRRRERGVQQSKGESYRLGLCWRKSSATRWWSVPSHNLGRLRSFSGISAEEFAAFHEPGYVKSPGYCVRTGSVPTESVARTETRVITTDPVARARFGYWAFVIPGILLTPAGLTKDCETNKPSAVKARQLSCRSLLSPDCAKEHCDARGPRAIPQ